MLMDRLSFFVSHNLMNGCNTIIKSWSGKQEAHTMVQLLLQPERLDGNHILLNHSHFCITLYVEIVIQYIN